jgi:hypothetical protein
MAQLMSRENRLLNARRQLQILFNLSQRFAQPRIARGEVSLEERIRAPACSRASSLCSTGLLKNHRPRPQTPALDRQDLRGR